jgi:hypothetical protein
VQTLGARQSADVEQLVRHTVPPQRYGLHEVESCIWHMPVPLQLRAGVAVAVVQVAAAQGVPLA